MNDFLSSAQTSTDTVTSVVSDTIATYDIPTQLAIIQNRQEIIITILLSAFLIALGCGVCYIFYRFLLRFFY